MDGTRVAADLRAMALDRSYRPKGVPQVCRRCGARSVWQGPDRAPLEYDPDDDPGVW
jgi:hypothetical protein